MKIIGISDFHGKTDVLGALLEKCMKEEPDCVVFCGDAVKGHARGDEWLGAKREGRKPVKTKEIEKERAKDGKELMEFYHTLLKLGVPLLAIPGNMDAPEEAYLSAMEKISAEGNVRLVHRKKHAVGGYSFAGFGGEIGEESERFFVLIYPEEVFLREMKELKADVLLFHSPPKDTKVDADNDKHIGSKAVRKVIEEMKPLLVFCGHAHKAKGIDRIGRTTIVNPGALKYGNISIVEIEGEKVSVKLTTLGGKK